MLRAAGATVWLEAADIPAEQQPEVLLIDSPQPAATGWENMGVVRVGADGSLCGAGAEKFREISCANPHT